MKKAPQNQLKDFSEMEIKNLIQNHLQYKGNRKNDITFKIALILSIVLILYIQLL